MYVLSTKNTGFVHAKFLLRCGTESQATSYFFVLLKNINDLYSNFE